MNLDEHLNKETKKLRVESVHGGDNVEEVVTPILVNDPACDHKTLVIDPTETEFIAYMCANPDCGMVKIFNK